MIEIEAIGLDKLVRNLSTIPIQQFLRDLMRGAEAMVDMFYASQSMSGNINYTTKVTANKNTATLTVSGEDVGFLEFGAGLSTEPDVFVSQVDYPVGVGSYSVLHRGQFANTMFSYWVYRIDGKPVWFNSLTPTHGMQAAFELLRTEIGDYLHDRIMQYIWDGYISSRQG